jgi:hypothetical protein
MACTASVYESVPEQEIWIPLDISYLPKLLDLY